MPCPCLGSVSGQCAELLGALSGILVSLGHDLFAAVGADDGRVTTQACGGAREMIAAARTDHLDLGFSAAPSPSLRIREAPLGTSAAVAARWCWTRTAAARVGRTREVIVRSIKPSDAEGSLQDGYV